MGEGRTRKVISSDSPAHRFFYIGMQFVLRGVQEQHNMMVSQLVRKPSDRSVYSTEVYYQYIYGIHL